MLRQLNRILKIPDSEAGLKCGSQKVVLEEKMNVNILCECQNCIARKRERETKFEYLICIKKEERLSTSE